MNQQHSPHSHWYEIAKYTPEKYIDHVYYGEDWTSISDIGKPIMGHNLSINEYLKVENRYIDTLIQILKESCCHYMIVHHAEIHVKNIRKQIAISPLKEIQSETLPQILSIEEGQRLSLIKTGELFRFCLREYIYLELTNNSKKVTVKPGYDYYMYVKTPIPINRIKTIVTNNELYLDPR